jgi:hypothetical protein
MKVLCRVIDWHDFVRSLEETRGTAIVERYSFHLRWTSENIYDLCPFPSVACDAWLEQHCPSPIDIRVQSDLAAGRLDTAIQRALDDDKSGRTQPL